MSDNECKGSDWSDWNGLDAHAAGHRHADAEIASLTQKLASMRSEAAVEAKKLCEETLRSAKLEIENRSLRAKVEGLKENLDLAQAFGDSAENRASEESKRAEQWKASCVKNACDLEVAIRRATEAEAKLAEYEKRFPHHVGAPDCVGKDMKDASRYTWVPEEYPKRMAEAEAEAAAMREALEEAKYLIIGPNGPLSGIDSKFIDRIEAALSSDAGKEVLDRVERLRAVARGTKRESDAKHSGEQHVACASPTCRSLAALKEGDL